MTEQDRRRAELYERTREVLGDEPARTLFEMFPDDDELARSDEVVSLGAHVDQVAAHVRDLDHRVEKLDQRVERLDHRVEKLDQRVEQLDQRVERLDHRVEQLDQRVERLDHRVGQLDQRAERLDHRVEQLDQRVVRLGSDMRGGFKDLKIEFKDAVSAAITSQTKTIALSVIGSVAALAAVMIASMTLGS